MYTVRFVDYNDSVISKEQYVYKAYPKIPLDRERKANQKYNYAFKGWSPSVDSVKSDTDYFAMYDSVLNKYLIRYKVGNQIMQSDSLEYGEMPSYKLEEPTKTATAKYEYKFVGWSPAVVAVTGSATYTAVFDSTTLQSIVGSPRITNAVAVYSSGIQILISDAKIGSSYTVFDVQGHVIANGIVDQKSFAVKTNSKGHYIVKLNGLIKSVSVE